MSVAAFDRTLIERYDISDLADVAARTPNFTFSNNLGLFGGVPVIRGVGAPRTGGASAVGIFIDGIDTGNTTGLNLQSFDVERIEVARGPQSTLFGRGVLAGAINYISRRPNLIDLEVEGAGELAEGGVYRVEGRVSGPIADGIAVSLAAQSRNMDGFYRNTLTGTRVGDSSSTTVVGGVRAKFGSDEQGEVYLRLAYSQEDIGQPAWHQVQTNTQTGALATQRWFIGTLKGNPSLVQHNADNYPGIDLEFYRAGLHFDYDFGGISVASISSYNKTRQISDTDVDYTGQKSFVAGTQLLGGFRSALDTDINDFSQELRLQTNQSNRFRWMVGGYFRKENYKLNDFSPTYLQGSVDILAPTPNVVTRTTQTVGVFGSAAFDITDSLTVTGEVRHAQDKISETNAPRAPGVPLSFAANFNNVLPRAIAEYKFDSRHMIYASVAKGSKPGGFNNSPGAGVVPNEMRFFDEEQAWVYEIGAKTSWLDNKLTVNGALFYNDWSNIQVNSQVLVDGRFVGLTVNGGKANGLGGELEMRYEPSQYLDIYGGLGYAPIRIIDYVDTRATTAGITTDGEDQIAGTPDWTGNVGALVTVPLGQTANAFFQGDLTYRSTTYATEAGLAETGARTRVDLQTGIKTGNLRIAVYVNNVLDDLSIDSTRAYVDPSTYRRTFLVQLTNPRQFGMRFSVKY